jgi:18S rRNA (guanine1575-N7)-methyltransferase
LIYCLAWLAIRWTRAAYTPGLIVITLGADPPLFPISLTPITNQPSSAGDVLQRDMGQGLPFRPGVFDGAISISALQWLCYEDSKAQSARSRLMRFFSSLYTALKRGARAALQFYPENTDQVGTATVPRKQNQATPPLPHNTHQQVLLITECATRVGFQGGLVVDYPNSSKAKKYYLCLSFEHTYRVPQALGSGDGAGVGVTERERAMQRGKGKKKGKRAGVKSRDWILQKKEQQRRRGLEVRPDTKYTGRKRREKF